MRTFIKAFKPFIAKSTDARLKKAFATAVDSVTAAAKKESKSGGGSYIEFAGAAARVANDGKIEESPAQKQAREMDAMYAEEMKKRGTRKRA